MTWFLVIANLLFYLWADRSSALLLLALTTVSFIAFRAMQSKPENQRLAWLWLGAATLVGCLACFKISASYFDTALPLGISFFTFQLLGALLDAKRGSFSTDVTFREYFASVAFFPTITAGPILRTQDFVPQLREKRAFDFERAKWGMLLITNGLFKKKIADLIAFTTQTRLQSDAGAASAWLGVLALSAQFYADFSGYSDMAIGVANVLGFSVPENFHLPYLATSVADHWRRWHISLYEWFRQYVFSSFLVLFWHRPEGWVRRIDPTVYAAVAIVLTMGLIGLWHAPTVSFVTWGILNGILIAVSPWIANGLGGFFRNGWKAIFLTFYITAVIRVLTVLDLQQSLRLVRELHFPIYASNFDARYFTELSFVAVSLILPHALDAALLRFRIWWTKSLFAWALMIIFLTFVFVMGGHDYPFLYQNF